MELNNNNNNNNNLPRNETNEETIQNNENQSKQTSGQLDKDTIHEEPKILAPDTPSPVHETCHSESLFTSLWNY
jgi:hypothetical protein